MDKAKVVEFMTTVMTSSPSLPAILLAEKRLDHTQVRFTFERNFDHNFLTIY